VRFLIDEMFPPGAAVVLREEFDHDTVHVGEIGLSGVDDSAVAAVARSERRSLVTENVADFAVEDELVLVCVLKRTLPAVGAQANALANLLNHWAGQNHRPYLGQHWPSLPQSEGR
jgi:predicted nuclease of predicted toxin-antitoxin system